MWSSRDTHAALFVSYPSKVGKIVYAMPASRADCAYTVGMLTRCLTFPTAAMDAAADRCLAFMAQTAERGPQYGKVAGRSDANLELHAYTDSDWQVRSSTSAWVIMYAGAVVAYGSKRQASISLSSTEAEIMAASQGAAEVAYIRGLLHEMGVNLTKPTVLYVDNSGAVQLSKDLKSCTRSRHIEPRYLWARELVHRGLLDIRYCPTQDNVADALTKPLSPSVFERHADVLFNAVRDETAVSGLNITPTVRMRTFDVEAAYLKGKVDETEVLYARPPPG